MFYLYVIRVLVLQRIELKNKSLLAVPFRTELRAETGQKEIIITLVCLCCLFLLGKTKRAQEEKKKRRKEGRKEGKKEVRNQ